MEKELSRGNLSFDTAKWMIVAVLISAFGPYLSPALGLRLEHFVLYGLLGGLFMHMCRTGMPAFSVNRPVKWIFIIFLVNLCWMALPTIMDGVVGGFRLYGLMATLENFIQPLALIVIVSWLLSGMNGEQKIHLLRVAMMTIIVMLCLNALLCLLTMFSDTSKYLQYFHGIGDPVRGTVASRAQTLGRYSGVFNQPLESGVAYSIGLLCWVYLSATAFRVGLLAWGAALLLLLGGALSISKVFILGGLPLAAALWLWFFIAHRRSWKLLPKDLFMGIGAGMVVAVLGQHWKGWKFFSRLFEFNFSSVQDFLLLFTAGRLGIEETALKARFLNVWNEAPLWGFGAFVQDTLDNAWFQFFLHGGIPGLMFYLAVLAVVLFQAARSLSLRPELGRLLLALWILVIGAGIGTPVLTINRGSILLWVILVIVFSIVGTREITAQAGHTDPSLPQTG